MTNEPIPLDVATKALDAFFGFSPPNPWTRSELARMQRALAAVRPMLPAEADREIAALKIEIARLREGHRESFNVFDIMLELDIMTRRARYHRDRCKALAEGREP